MSLELIREYLSYNPETVVFRWSRPSNGRIKIGDVAGSIKANGYRYILFRDKAYLAHRLAWFFVYGVMPNGPLDHKNTQRADNRIGNLRLATHGQNHANAQIQSNNTSGFKGVRFHKRDRCWTAQIGIDGKTKHLGHFDTAEEAARAYNAAALIHFREFARLNFVESA